MDFNPFEHAVHGVGIFMGELPGLFQRRCLDHDETPCLVCQGAGQDDPACLVERFHLGQMSGAVDFAFGFAVRAVDDDGMHLTKFVKKDVWDSLNVPEE